MNLARQALVGSAGISVATGQSRGQRFSRLLIELITQ
jgi:hypothetical protein